jgi:hypothetical protein
MSNKKTSADDSQLSDAIRSLQNLLDDVRTDRNIVDSAEKKEATGNSSYSSSEMEQTDEFPALDDTDNEQAVLDQTAELSISEDTATLKALSETKEAFDIDSHFDMNIPPALPDDEEQDIPTLSETIVGGDIPVLKEIVKLPDGSTIPEPEDIDLESAIKSGNLPTPIMDAAEAAADAVQIILARYHSKPMPPETREQLKTIIIEFLGNASELEIPRTILD